MLHVKGSAQCPAPDRYSHTSVMFSLIIPFSSQRRRDRPYPVPFHWERGQADAEFALEGGWKLGPRAETVGFCTSYCSRKLPCLVVIGRQEGGRIQERTSPEQPFTTDIKVRPVVGTGVPE